MTNTKVYDCTIIEIDKHHHQKGNISVIENGLTVPFDVKRIYYLYDVPGVESRGGDAYMEFKQLLSEGSGSCKVTLADVLV